MFGVDAGIILRLFPQTYLWYEGFLLTYGREWVDGARGGRGYPRGCANVKTHCF